MEVKKYIRYLFGLTFIGFVLNKLCIRPWVLEHTDWMPLKIFVLSAPNLAEAIIGSIVATGILLRGRAYMGWSFSHRWIYGLASALGGVYVISQELKYHNLGGNNVYDPYDLAASVIGIVACFIVFNLCGFIRQPR